ncbi:MAG: rhomboid family intramembrane serine protease [Chitinophagales bacterium]|nr:MAG: rhomboid family intramembrane serine protease [Chitinophagales bacterium]
MYGRVSIWDDLKREFQSGNIIIRLIMINVAVFLLVGLVHGIVFLIHPDRQVSEQLVASILKWVMLPADTRQLLKSPWTLFTHMFMHQGVFHLIFNMLWLYWFGLIIQEFIGSRRILPLYLYGGLTGALLLIISYNIFPGLHSEMPYVRALGASAAVLAIVVAAATLVPDYTVFLLFLGPVRIKYIALVLVIIDLVSIPDVNTGGHIAHLGGALLGYVFIKQLQHGNDWSIPFYRMTDWVKRRFIRSSTPRMVYKTKNTVRRKRQSEPDPDKQQRIDEILDKISRSGYDSLSKEEKEFLFRVSREK